jgi:hypothetical protein
MSDPSLPPQERQPGPAQRPYAGPPGQQQQGQPHQGQPHQGRPPQQYPHQPYPPQPYQQQPYLQQPPFAPDPHQQPPRFPVRRPSEETRRDVEAAWGARMELGPDYEEHIAAGLADRVEELAAERAAEVYRESERARLAARSEHSGRVRQFVLGIISLVMGVPITAIAGETTEPGLLGVAIAWGGIVGVNAVHALSSRRKKSS